MRLWVNHPAFHKSKCLNSRAAIVVGMAGETMPSNITVSFHGHAGTVISINSKFLFTVFSVTLHLLANIDIAVILNDSLNLTQISLPVQDANRLCLETAIFSITNKTFYCQHKRLSTSHHLAVLDLKQNNIKTVSTVSFIVYRVIIIL